MNPLYRNDRPGHHAPSVYAAGITPLDRPGLTGSLRADVAVIGAGFTGLWATKTLAEAGRDVVVLDAHRVGFGASGRNGGQVLTGFNWEMSDLHAKLGHDRAHALWDLAETGKAQVKDFAQAHPECAFRPGSAHAEYWPADFKHYAPEADFLQREFGFSIEVLDRAAFRDVVKTGFYAGGMIDRSAGHLNPLAYATALARNAEAVGARIFEKSEVTEITTGPTITLHTPRGRIEAGHVIVAGNGYLPGLLPPVNARVLPINSFIAATTPLPDRWQDVLAENLAVADSRFVTNYYRFDENDRFLFGGRESYAIGFPRDISTALIARMEAMFPQLKGVGIDYVWGGSLGITPTRLPYVASVGPNILAAGGFSGMGVVLTSMAGRVMGEAVLGQEDGLATFDTLPVPRFPGGAAFRGPILTLAMMWFALRDRIGF